MRILGEDDMVHIRSCALALLLTTASPLVAHAEQAAASGAGPAPAGEAPSAAVQEVVVTGSRIPRINEKSANPVAVVTSQEVKLQGATHVEDLLNTLPQVNA